MGKTQRLVRENDFFIFTYEDQATHSFRRPLWKLHRSCGHTSVSALYSILKRDCSDEVSVEVKRALDHLTENCKIYFERACEPSQIKIKLETLIPGLIILWQLMLGTFALGMFRM